MLSLLRPLLVACLYLLLLPGGQGYNPGYNNGFHYQDISNGNGKGESRSPPPLCVCVCVCLCVRVWGVQVLLMLCEPECVYKVTLWELMRTQFIKS